MEVYCCVSYCGGDDGESGIGALLIVETGMMTVGGELGGEDGVQVTTSWTSARVPSFFLKEVRPLTVAICPEVSLLKCYVRGRRVAGAMLVGLVDVVLGGMSVAQWSCGLRL